METTNLSRIEQAVAYVNEVSNINERFKGTSVSMTARLKFNEKGEISISSYIWVSSTILRSSYIYNIEKDENYNKFLAFKKENDELLAKSAEGIEIDCYEQKIAELKEKLNQYGKKVFHHCLRRD